MAISMAVMSTLPTVAVEAIRDAVDTDPETKALSIKVLMAKAMVESGEATIGGVTLPMELIELIAVIGTRVLNQKDYEGGKSSGIYVGDRPNIAKIVREAWDVVNATGGARTLDAVEERLA